MKILPFFLLLPIAAVAQTSEPVFSKDYLDQVNKNRQKIFYTDTTNNARNALLQVADNYYGYPIRKIRVTNGRLNIQRAYPRTLYLSGSFNTVVSIKSINRLPSLQDEFVQGRSDNGKLLWRGAETNEQFSYGPNINSLEYDGSNYSYDINGRLVPLGFGNGRKPKPYANSIFRTGSFLSQALVLQARYTAKGVYTTRLKIGQSDEQTVIRNNKNASANFSVVQDATINGFIFNASFTHTKDRFSNPNRNGFLSRAYQASLLTPVSFDNFQGFRLVNDQRRFSDVADNPLFLLEDNINSFNRSHNIGSLSAEKRFSNIKIKIVQSAERINEDANEGYKPFTAFFTNGIFTTRRKNDATWFTNVSGSADIEYNNYDFRSTASINYAITNSRTQIDYENTGYNYKRASHDLAFSFLTTLDKGALDAGLKVGNKFYASNTTMRNDFFLPEISGYLLFDNIFNANGLFFKLSSNFVNFNSELPISTSFAQHSLTRLNSEDANQFFPITEVKDLDNLNPIRHQEWTVRAELSYRNKLTLTTEVFDRKIGDDVFPVFDNGQLMLRNLGDHRNSGVELMLSYSSYAKQITTSNSVSFATYKDVVTNVKSGFDLTPTAGFNDVHRAIVNGKALGVIVGNDFLKDAQNNMIIGADGFPIVNPVPSVIGDPTPDFIVKTTNTVSWKKFSFTLDCEWRKGGDIWNGTQAVLDYFGRSKTTAQLRNTTGYIFPGVLADGHTNNIPVDFYDPDRSVDKNRWVRYGYSGIAAEYIHKADYIRINNLSLSYKLSARKYIQTISFSLFASNLFLWSAYKGADVNQLLYDQSNAYGLDFFNIPSSKNYGFNVAIQF